MTIVGVTDKNLANTPMTNRNDPRVLRKLILNLDQVVNGSLIKLDRS